MRRRNTGKTKVIRLLSLFLAVTMLVTVQGFTSLASAVSQNKTVMEENEKRRNSADSEMVNTTLEETVMQAGAATPANPVHNCTGAYDGSDTTTWSYVYFGSYPQSEVTNTSIISSIDSAILAGNGATEDVGVDVWVDGTKYRRISKSDTNYSGCFDNVSNNGYRYFKWERIKWRVLNNNGETLFVIADEALDCKNYNEKYVDITWEDSTIRNWLNDSFYKVAFSSKEQSAVVPQNIVNEDNPLYGTEGGNNTTDNIYLLSISEVTNSNYGFCSNDDTFSASRRLQASAYANARGITESTSSGYEGNCWWWLRSPGRYSFTATFIYDEGVVSRSGSYVANDDYGVVPALHINLLSGIWSMTDDGTSGEGENSGGNIEVEIPNISIDSSQCGIFVYDAETNRPISNVSVVADSSSVTTDATGVAKCPADDSGMEKFVSVVADGYNAYVSFHKLTPGGILYIPLYVAEGEDLKLITATAELESKTTNLLNDKLYLSNDSENILSDSTNSKELKLSVRARGDIAKYEIISNGKIIMTSETGEFSFPVVTDYNGTTYTNPLISKFSPQKDVNVRATDTNGNTSMQILGIRICELGKEIEEVKKTGKVSLGKSISLTLPEDVPFLGGQKISYGFKDGLPFDLEIGADGKVKIAINKKTDQNFERFKEDYDKLSSRAKDLNNAAQSFGGTPQSFGAGYVTVNGSICGYGEGYFNELDNGKLTVNVGVILSVKASAGYTQYFFAGYIPFYVTVESGIKVSSDMKVSMLYENGMLDLRGGFGDMTGKVYLTAGAGVGVNDLVSVEVNGTGDVNVLWKPANDYWKVWASLGMAIHSDLFGWSLDLWESPKMTYNIFETGVTTQEKVSKAGTTNLYDTTQYRLIDRSYLDYENANTNTVNILQKAGATADETNLDKEVVKQAVYPSAEPKLIEVDGTSYLFWLEDIPERNAENRSALVYATSADGKNFTEPKQLVAETENQTADYSFDLCKDSGKIYICWQDGKEVLKSGASLSQVVENLQISYAKLNVTSGEVEEVKTLTTTPGCYLMPKITVCDGKPYAAWVQCNLGSSKNVLDTNNIHTINCMDIQENTRKEYTALSKEQTIASMDLGLNGNAVAILCEVDEDGNLSSMEDRELYMDETVNFLKTQDSLVRFSTNEMVDSSPRYAIFDGSGSWFWYQNGNICYTKELSTNGINQIFAESPANMNSNFSLVEGNNTVQSIIWEAVDQEAEDESTGIFATSYEDGNWTKAYKLCNTGSAFTSSPNGYDKNDIVTLVYKHSAWQNDGSVIYSIMVTNQGQKTKTSLESVSYEVEDVKQGENLTLSMVVKNEGNTTIDTLEFSTNGNTFATITDAALGAGESKVYEVDGFLVDSTLSQLTEYPIMVKAQGETVDADNEYLVSIGYTDLYLKVQTRYFEEANWLDVSVLNNSCIPSKGTLVLYADKEQGEVLYSQPIDTVTKEEGIGLSMSLEEYDKEHSTFYLCIEAEKEESILTNSQELIYTGYGTEIKGGSLVKDPVTYTVTFNSDGGSEVQSQSIVEGEMVVEPIPPTKEGYHFVGWYFAEDEQFDFTTVIDQNMTLTAKWKAYGKAAMPNATHSSGADVLKNTKVSLTCATLGAQIYFTIDGTVPTTSSTLYTEAITIEREMTIKAIAVCEGYIQSDVAEFSYKINENESATDGNNKQSGNDNQSGSDNQNGNSDTNNNAGTNINPVIVQKLSIVAPSKKLAAGKKVKLSLTVSPENATNKAVTWKTNNKKYAIIDNNGKLTLKKAGAGKTVTVTATATDGSGVKANYKIKIMKHAVKSIKLSAASKTVNAGKSIKIKATIKTNGKKVNKTLKWTSSNTKYATVSKSGKVKTKKAGKGKTVTITATSTDGTNKKAKIKLKIK